MKILALERELPGASAEKFRSASKAEARRAWELHQAGLIRELYFRADQPLAILILECASLANATTVLATLPLVQAGVITFDLIPLQAYSGFARLFADSQPAGSEQ
jgi:hypothetical protein